ncbi:DUF4153 domain-containing protein [Streptomyces sp. TLI_171]|uniref:DUF4153 domain-containing protein n=1 Tax=Streptomyces sp. TLI_171 TaxID=1938859 RepID=UPI000C3FF3D9|nr:DUF4173 domain-containing protein [Streptomyces sp. TLI_171]RKE21518.1 uncharacterized protein DUF4173 [Streptomyces sp. TLI_171]
MGGVAAAAAAGAGPNPYQYRPFAPPPEPDWLRLSKARPAEPARLRVVGAALGTGLVGAIALGDGFGVNLLLCALVAAVGAALTAFGTGRTVKPWHTAFAVASLLLCLVPAVSGSGLAVFLALTVAVGVASLALHGGTRWPGVALGSIGLLAHLLPGLVWGIAALKDRRFPARNRVAPVAKAVLVSLVLLIVFGALFSGADSTVADLLESLVPSVDGGEIPFRAVLFFVSAVVALGAAHTAAAPRRWDRVNTPVGKERGRLEWAMPLVVLNLLFGTFVVVQLVVLVGGYSSIMSRTGMTPAAYARQGFWQLLWIAVLTLAVVALAKYWAPRSNEGDRRMVKILLGLLCTLTLVVVGTALVRMSLYMDAFGLTRLRVNVAAVEIWLGLVFLMVLFGSVLSTRRWLPRAVVLSAAAAVAVFGLLRTDGLIAQQNIDRELSSGTRLDVGYLRTLSVDAVPALDGLTGDYRTCALQPIAAELADEAAPPWYAISQAESRAREILAERPVTADRGAACRRIGFTGYESRTDSY